MLVFVRFQCQHESRGRSSYSFRRQQICFPWYIPPQSSSHQQTCFSSWSAFFLVFKNLKGSFIFQQSLVFDWVPVRQSLYFFFSWMDSRFILSPSTLLCSLWSVFKPNPSLNAARHTNLSSDTPVAADGVCSLRGGRDFFWSLSEV